MSLRTLSMTDAIHEYLVSETLREPEVCRGLRARTAELPNAQMQISPEQGQFMMLVVELLGARRALEIGTFTGYSALCVATALPADGRLIACDVSDEWTSIGREFWAEAGVAEKIDLRLGPALATLDALFADGAAGSFDFAFIDADKENYGAYYDRVIGLLRPGGVVALDNALRGGRVADPLDQDVQVAAMRSLNARIRDDSRVSMSLVPIGDGLMLARKRG